MPYDFCDDCKTKYKAMMNEDGYIHRCFHKYQELKEKCEGEITKKKKLDGKNKRLK